MSNFIQFVREIVAYPFYIIALAFIWMDCFILEGLAVANATLDAMLSEEDDN